MLNTIITDEKIAPYVDEKAYVAYVESLLDGLAGASQIINIDIHNSDAKSKSGKDGVPPAKKTD